MATSNTVWMIGHPLEEIFGVGCYENVLRNTAGRESEKYGIVEKIAGKSRSAQCDVILRFLRNRTCVSLCFGLTRKRCFSECFSGGIGSQEDGEWACFSRFLEKSAMMKFYQFFNGREVFPRPSRRLTKTV
ncbi:MAG: hypothetical protein LBG65_05955 [Puniceicoccales bacterium]|jgi:hypothetical protein|nr:hypothetical protein [Puniceicoccales bacterium]